MYFEQYSNVSITYSKFIQNEARLNGGAIHGVSIFSFSISNSDINDNKCRENGCGIFF